MKKVDTRNFRLCILAETSFWCFGEANFESQNTQSLCGGKRHSHCEYGDRRPVIINKSSTILEKKIKKSTYLDFFLMIGFSEDLEVLDSVEPELVPVGEAV